MKPLRGKVRKSNFMTRVIEILYLEDSLADRELVGQFLAEGGMECHVVFLSTREEFTRSLQDGKWDIILADFALPGFDGISALGIAQRLCPRTPFILLSGVMGEDVAVESMKSGATDYVRKQGIKRLCPAVRRALKEAEIEAELELSRARAVSSDRLSALGMMAGGIAHEINNPLAIIYASANNLLEMAESGTVPLNELQKASTRIKRTAERISRIVTSLRLIAREGSADPFQPASVGEMIEQALELCKERFRANSVRLETSLVDATLHVSCREVQIAQVLLNLLQNAFDAVADLSGDRWVRLEVATSHPLNGSREGTALHTELSARKAQLTQETPHRHSERSLRSEESLFPEVGVAVSQSIYEVDSNHEQSVIFAVIDSGPGVPPELRARIMEPFFTTKPVGKGTGLGLSLSKVIVEDHGGELKLSETANHTCFSFSLPLLKEPEHATEKRHSIAGR